MIEDADVSFSYYLKVTAQGGNYAWSNEFEFNEICDEFSTSIIIHDTQP